MVNFRRPGHILYFVLIKFCISNFIKLHNRITNFRTKFLEVSTKFHSLLTPWVCVLRNLTHNLVLMYSNVLVFGWCQQYELFMLGVHQSVMNQAQLSSTMFYVFNSVSIVYPLDNNVFAVSINAFIITSQGNQQIQRVSNVQMS